MSIKYRLVQKRNMAKDAEVGSMLYYASSAVSGAMDFEAICSLIADRSTASDGDVALVVSGLIRAMEEALLRNEVVQLGGLGNFRLSIGSSGTVTQEEFQASLIRRPKIIFTPGERLRAMIERVSLERVSESNNNAPVPTEPEEDEPVVQ